MNRPRRKNGNSATCVYKKCPRCGEKTLRKGPRTPGGKTRWVCRAGTRGERTYCYSTVNPEGPVRDQKGDSKAGDANPQFRRKLGGMKRFVVTAAQNATPVNEPFFNSLLEYCNHNDAELVVIPIRYKNATSRWSESQENLERWDPALAPYLYNQRKKLCPNLVLLADVKTQPTAVNPLSGYEAMTHGESGILGHTKLQLHTVPTPQGYLPKIMTTTGAVTVPNYTDSKAGKLGEFHHTAAAVAVDIVGKKFFMYQLNATKDGSFQHLTTMYSPAGVFENRPVEALVFGDTHRKFIDNSVEDATFGKAGMVETLDPTFLVFHDLHDAYAENVHHHKKPFISVAKRLSGFDNVRDEINGDVSWLREKCRGRLGIIVASNHDNMLYRWIENNDWRLDPTNADFYLETALHMVRSTVMTDQGSSTPDPFAYWINKAEIPGLRCLHPDESFNLNGVELGFHGDRGPNGTRGSRKNMRRIGVKTFIGHAHSPGIDEGCYQVGTSTPLKLEYTGGPSSWMHCHGVVYPSGKRSLLFIVDGHWRLA